MLKQTRILFDVCVLLGLIMHPLVVQASKTVVIKKETALYVLNIKYPQGFKSKEIDNSVKNFIEKSKKDFLSQLSGEEKLPVNVSGKSSLNIDYSIPYQSKSALSIRFNSSFYYRGAAHPINVVDVSNFINNQSVKLKDLFLTQSDFLNKIAVLSKKEITAKHISDAKWINEGTQPVAKNYRVWRFSKNGIVILFNTYQVAAYVYGPQAVEIPLNIISPILKPGLKQVVWSSNE